MNHLLRRAANYCSPTSSMKKVRRRPPSKRCDRNVSEDKTSSRSSEIGLVVMNCRGYANLENEVLYLPPRNQGTVKGNVVLIPGDAQDLHRRMLKAGHAEWAQYSLENTAQLLADKFPGHGVIVVSPAKHVDGGLASYDNFASTDYSEGGAVPEYLPEGAACLHLEALLQDAASRSATSTVAGNFGTNPNGPALDTSLPLTLVGFSKGVVVLNQMVTELACESRQTTCWSGEGDDAAADGDDDDDDDDDGDDNGGVYFESYRGGSESFTRKRPPSYVACDSCDGGGRVDAGGFAAGSPESECGWEEGQDSCDGSCDWSWGREDEHQQQTGPKERPKKAPRKEEELSEEPREVAQAHREQGNDSGLTELPARVSLSPSSSVATLSSTSLGSTTDESQVAQELGGENWKCMDEQEGDPDPEECSSTLGEISRGQLGCSDDLISAPSREEVVEGQQRGDQVGHDRNHSRYHTDVHTYMDDNNHTKDSHSHPADSARRRLDNIAAIPDTAREGGECANSGGVPTAPQTIARGATRTAAGGGGEGERSAAARRLFDRVVALHWIDGGNGDLAGSFPNNPAALASLSSRRDIAIRVHGTPYQWGNPCRPWLSLEKDVFLTSVGASRRAWDRSTECRLTRVRSADIREAGCTEPRGSTSAALSVGSGGVSWSSDGSVKSFEYFESQLPSLDAHFRTLAEFSPE